MNLFKKLTTFVQDVKVEMTKVSWPNRDDLQKSTIVVIVITLLFSGFTFIADRTLSEVVQLLYSYIAGN